MTDTDEELMASLQAGDEHSLTILYGRWYTPLLNYLRSQVQQDRDVAEDVLQQVFLRVHKHSAEFTPGKLFRPWLYAIADRLGKNAKRDAFRRVKNFRPSTDVGPDVERLESNDWLGHCGGKLNADRQPDQDSQKQARLAALPQAVLELPYEQRRPVQFVLVTGASLRTAERILVIGRRTLSKRMREASETIAQKLGDSAFAPTATYNDLQLSMVSDMLDQLSASDQEAVGRAVLGNSRDERDMSAFRSLLFDLMAI
ncbi:RNA polymerase sigma factor [Anatilimnocola floriformis]|uniref:RNA polymerase sigma factor n=1 Tax=Anatilimnocola floriformis TaxID=2948575 RepID=UPI0020C279DB|nr:sigma-70 family RNA polymerase sigma factor [Anatilimnocola floriformis]